MPKTTISSSQNIFTLIRGEVVNVMREVLSDPDAGLKLTASFNRHLTKSVIDKRAGKIVPLSKILKQYDI